MTENRTLSNRDSHISTQAVRISCVLFVPVFKKRSISERCSGVAVGEMSAVPSSSRRNEDFPVPRPPTTCDAMIELPFMTRNPLAHTIRLNVGGCRVLLCLVVGGAILDDFQISNADGGWDIYREDIVPPFASLSTDGPRNGL